MFAAARWTPCTCFVPKKFYPQMCVLVQHIQSIICIPNPILFRTCGNERKSWKRSFIRYFNVVFNAVFPAAITYRTSKLIEMLKFLCAMYDNTCMYKWRGDTPWKISCAISDHITVHYNGRSIWKPPMITNIVLPARARIMSCLHVTRDPHRTFIFHYRDLRWYWK